MSSSITACCVPGPTAVYTCCALPLMQAAVIRTTAYLLARTMTSLLRSANSSSSSSSQQMRQHHAPIHLDRDFSDAVLACFTIGWLRLISQKLAPVRRVAAVHYLGPCRDCNISATMRHIERWFKWTTYIAN